jgi:hypothetical protein
MPRGCRASCRLQLVCPGAGSHVQYIVHIYRRKKRTSIPIINSGIKERGNKWDPSQKDSQRLYSRQSQIDVSTQHQLPTRVTKPVHHYSHNSNNNGKYIVRYVFVQRQRKDQHHCRSVVPVVVCTSRITFATPRIECSLTLVIDSPLGRRIHGFRENACIVYIRRMRDVLVLFPSGGGWCGVRRWFARCGLQAGTTAGLAGSWICARCRPGVSQGSLYLGM